MPSGAKKRKAAKKKKENQHTSNSNQSSVSTLSRVIQVGDGNLKQHDDKGSDVGELSSPASQDHHSHQSQFTEGEEEEIEIEKERNRSNLPPVEGSKTYGNKIRVEREFKIEGEIDKENGISEHDEPSRKSYDGGSSGSSSGNSSGSDDETHRNKNGQAAGNNVSSAESVIKQNGKKKVSSVQDKVSTSVAYMDTALNEEAIIQSDEKTSAIRENNEPRNTADNGVEHEKDSGVTQPLLAHSPAPAQKTSWKSCCGLFEVISGSSS